MAEIQDMESITPGLTRPARAAFNIMAKGEHERNAIEASG